jgi:hypothetical protein
MKTAMNSRLSRSCWILLLLSCVLPAQRGEKFVVPQVKRAVVTDDNGLQQWAEFKYQNCATCRGLKVHKCKHCDGLEWAKTCLECDWKKKSPCRDCGGRGQTQDPLLWVVCPGCHGAGCFPCALCRNEGCFPIQGGSKKPAKCGGCKTLGGYKCGVCKGKRLVCGPALKPSVGEASLKDLLAAKKKIGQTLTALATFRPTHNTSKDLKAYAKALAPAARVLPSLKKCQAMVKTILKGLKKGDAFVENDQKKAAGFDLFRIYNQLYLQHQQQVIDLCIQRQEFNTNVMAKKKDAR